MPKYTLVQRLQQLEDSEIGKMPDFIREDHGSDVVAALRQLGADALDALNTGYVEQKLDKREIDWLKSLR